MKYKIEELCEINSENISKSDDIKYIYYLDTSNLTRGTINEIQKLIVGKDKLPSRAKRKVKVNDILISTVRPNQRHYGIIRKEIENLIVSTGFAVLSPNLKKVNPEYLYWYLTQDSIVNYLQSIAETSTSAYPSIKPSVIGGLEIDLPKLEEQKAIANILSTLDEKIETNNQINEKLEEMAQALFKHWFVDFEFPNENGEPYKSSGGEMVESELGMIPKGWNVVTLEKIAELIMGLSPKSSTYNEDGIGLPLLNGAADFDKNNLRPSRFTSDPKRVSKKEDWLLCIRGTIGNLTFSDGDYALGRGVAAIRAKESMYREIIYFNLQKSIKELISLASGSVISGLSKQDINNLKIITPDKKILTVFHNLIHKIQQEQIDLKSQNKVLSKIRDILLPKLMSGEIRVPLDDEVLSEKN
jgi:type I restriction enzyme, S subunit